MTDNTLNDILKDFSFNDIYSDSNNILKGKINIKELRAAMARKSLIDKEAIGYRKLFILTLFNFLNRFDNLNLN